MQEVLIRTNKQGQKECGNFSFSARPARYHHVETQDVTIHFSLAWRPIFLQGKKDWPNPAEWLKISLSGRPLYYSSLGYGNLTSLFHQFYVPFELDGQYDSNTNNINERLAAKRALTKMKALASDFVESECNDPLWRKAIGRLEFWNHFSIVQFPLLLRAQVKVLPPDCMRCDYDVFPIILATGCLYNCGFCRFKDGTDHSPRTKMEIESQTDRLLHILRDERTMFKGVFLGNQDALGVSDELIFYAIALVREKMPWIKNVFLFASADSFLNKGMSFFSHLEESGLNYFINVGIESVDEATLALLKKPVAKDVVMAAWHFINLINQKFPRLEISLNILVNQGLPRSHWADLFELLHEEKPFPKGTIYLVPFDEPIGRYFFNKAKAVRMATKRPVRVYNLIGL